MGFAMLYSPAIATCLTLILVAPSVWASAAVSSALGSEETSAQHAAQAATSDAQSPPSDTVTAAAATGAESSSTTAQNGAVPPTAPVPLGTAGESSRAAAPGPDIWALAPILDDAYRHRSALQLELAPYAAQYLSATLGSTFAFGARGIFHFNNMLALGADYGRLTIKPDESSEYFRNLQSDRMQYVKGALFISNATAMRVGERGQLELDLYGMLGGGMRELNGEWGPVGTTGGGLKVYPGLSWFAFSVGVDAFIHQIEKRAGAPSIESDMAFFLAASFLLPSQPSVFESSTPTE